MKTFEYRWEVEEIGQGHYFTDISECIEEARSQSEIWGAEYTVKVEQFRPERVLLIRFCNGKKITKVLIR